MEARKLQFLKAVLGDDGASALSKAAERAPELGAALLPRTIMAWLGVAARDDFEGTIPGVENTYLQFQKSEDRYSGSVSVGDDVYSFETATVLHLGACMAVALGFDHERTSPRLKDLDIQRLGKNIDTLVKARMAIAEIRKRALEAKKNEKPAEPKCSTCGFVQAPEDRAKSGGCKDGKPHSWPVAKGEKKVQGGAEQPGPAHAPTPQEAPLAPIPPSPTQTSKGPIVSLRPKPPKLPTPKAADDQVQTGTGAKPPKSKAPTLKVTKAQAEVKCKVCDGEQFSANKFTGCLCMHELAKSTYTEVQPDGYLLRFGADWDQDAILTLIESLGRK